MSRKTRKLMWSVPLVAAVAVIGALAIIVSLQPNGAAAHEAPMHGPPGPVTGLDAAVATGNDDMGQPAGRTQIALSWMAPDDAMSGTATSYRIDYSDNTRIWKNLLGGESGDDALMDDMAMSNCAADAAEGMRCFTDDSLMPGQLRHYRVFAMNHYGTSPVSIEPTYVTETTVDYARPSAARMLTATTTLVDSIVLDWQRPTDLGGATLLWYCIAVGTSEATVPNLTDGSADSLTCVNATEATEGDVAVGVARIVVPADMTTYTHSGLDDPAIISQYYRVYAVTDRDGDADTFTDADHPNERYISLAASNTANGRTVSPLPDVDTDVDATPDPVTNLRYVASRANAGTDVTLNLYWTHPANYPADDPDTDTVDERERWRIEVQRWNPTAGTNNAGAFETVAGAAVTDGSTAAQWTSTANAQTLTLNDAEQLFQVRYVNNVDGTNDTPDDGDATNDNDVYGIVERFHVPQTTAENYEVQDLPTIAATSYTADPQTGLRFKHNEVNPTIWLDLVWTADTPADTANNNTPTGYAIDYTDAAAINQHTMWKSLPNARRPSDLGATTQYTHKGVTPGKQYTYRVFPEFGSHNITRYDYRYGLPAMEDAASKEADLPKPVQGLMVVPDPENPQTALQLTWNRLPDDPKGHPVEGYLVQVANDRDNNGTLNTEAGGFDWLTLAIQDDTDTGDVDESRPWTVDKDTLMYVYDGSDLATTETLAGGYVRWFHVIAITDENDGDTATGGSARNPADGEPVSPPSGGEVSPNASDELTALPKDGKTAPPEAPDAPSMTMSPPMPEDLTSEQASDNNLLEPTDSGVFLTWNEPGEDAGGINAYVVQRKVGTGDWTPIARVTARTSYSDDREYIDGEDLQYRVGSLGASSVPASYTYPVTYPTHQAMHAPNAPTGVTATADSATEVTVSWTTPTDNGGSPITGFKVMYKVTGAADDTYETDMVSDPMASMHTVMGLMPNTSYDFKVVATNAEGDGYASMMAMAMTMAGMLTAPSMVVATEVNETAGGEPLPNPGVRVTWTDGEGAIGHLVLLFDSSDWSLADTATMQDSGDTTFFNVAPGNYLAVVVAYDADTNIELTISEPVSVGGS